MTDSGEILESGAEAADPRLFKTSSLTAEHFYDFDVPASNGDDVETPDANKDRHGPGASICSDLYLINHYQCAYPPQIIGTDMYGTIPYDTDPICGTNYRSTADHDQYPYDLYGTTGTRNMFYDCDDYAYDDPELPSKAPAAFRTYTCSFDNIEPKLSSEAPSAFRAYAYTLEKLYDLDYGDKFVI